jgi:hypothetical protein
VSKQDFKNITTFLDKDDWMNFAVPLSEFIEAAQKAQAAVLAQYSDATDFQRYLELKEKFEKRV